MAELSHAERLQPSLLDRLTDDAPEQRREALDKQVLTMSQLRAAVLRDLGHLLNATSLVAAGGLPSQSPAASSTLNYGIPSVAGMESTDSSGSSLERDVLAAIRAFEPRLRAETLQVRARPVQRDEGLPTLTLEISGELWAQPVPQQIFLETAIEIETHFAVVTEAKARA